MKSGWTIRTGTRALYEGRRLGTKNSSKSKLSADPSCWELYSKLAYCLDRNLVPPVRLLDVVSWKLFRPVIVGTCETLTFGSLFDFAVSVVALLFTPSTGNGICSLDERLERLLSWLPLLAAACDWLRDNISELSAYRDGERAQFTLNHQSQIRSFCLNIVPLGQRNEILRPPSHMWNTWKRVAGLTSNVYKMQSNTHLTVRSEIGEISVAYVAAIEIRVRDAC